MINHNAENTLMTSALQTEGREDRGGRRAFEAGGQKFNAGSFIIKTADNPGDLKQALGGPSC